MISTSRLSLVLAAGLPAFAGGDVDFDAPRVFEGPATDIIVADLDGDGLRDFVSNADPLTVSWGLGDTLFERQELLGGGHLSIADLDVDGDLDIVVVSSSTRTVHLNEGDRTFSTTITSSFLSPRDVELADMTGDGLPDLVQTRWFSLMLGGRVDVFPGRGDGTFDAFDPLLSLELDDPETIAVGDLDGDGDPDLAVQNGSFVAIIENTATDPLVLAHNYFVNGMTSRDVALGDLDEDGNLDLVLAGFDGPFQNQVGVLVTSAGIAGDVAFAGPVVSSYEPNSNFAGVTVAPVVAGGSPTIAVSDSTAEVVRIFSVDGTVVSEPLLTVDIGGLPRRPRLGDVTNDGQPDLLVGDFDSDVTHLRVNDGSGLFTEALAPIAANGTGELLVADMNADGLDDLVIVPVFFDEGLSVHVWLQDGAGSFVPSASLATPGTTLGGATLGDFNGDGALDVAVATRDGQVDGWLAVHPGDGLGTFAAPVTAALPSNGNAIASADFDLDGTDDIVVATRDPVFLVKGDGALSLTLELVPGKAIWSADMAVGDVHGDGLPDVLVQRNSSSSGPATLLFPGLPNGTLGAGNEPFGTFLTLTRNLLVDVDDDGLADWIGPNNIQGFLEVRPSLGDGNFSSTLNRVTFWSDFEKGIRQAVVADLDGDGIEDLAAAIGPAGAVSIVRGLGAATYGTPKHYAAGAGLSGLAAVDIGGDGQLDLVANVSPAGAPALVVLTNSTVESPWCDLGKALAGTQGEPSLSGLGTLLPDTLVALRVTAANASSATSLVVGTTLQSAPFKGGTLVPTPDLIISGLITDVDGDLLLPATWPSGFPSGFETFFQAWVVDPEAPKGLAATNGLSATTP